ALKLENVLVGKAIKGAPATLKLVDAGGDLLSGSWVHTDAADVSGHIKGRAPERIRGLGCTAASDIYALGALLYEVLTGKPPLQETSATDLAFAHLSKTPRPAKEVAPKGWIDDELNDLIASMLAKDPKKRPDLAAVGKLLGAKKKNRSTITDSELNDSVDLLVADPCDGEAAVALELLIERGADPKQVAEAFLMAADMVDVDEAAEAAAANEKSAAVAEVKAEAARDRARDTQKGLFARAARLFDTHVQDAALAEDAYKRWLALAPDDDEAQEGYSSALQAQDKLSDLVEHLLEVSDNSDDNRERASALHRIGRLYAGPLEDSEQALVAFTSALAADPQNDECARDLEKAAGDNMEQWAEAMRELHAACEVPDMAAADREALLLRLGGWYADKIGRADLALPCFEAILNQDPSNGPALEGMCHVYRRAQQWGELVQVLLSRAERAAAPERARDLRAEAASILDGRLDDVAGAREIYENTLKEDPGHEKTIEALAGIYKRKDDWDGYVKILKAQAEALTGTARAEALCKIAEIHEDQLNDLAEAERRYQEALEIDSDNLTAIRGL
ncbi:MAG TPA: hypothetical protein ENK23_07050, partial [Sorangium sp.]|nr:hypothetical protein [Sorangium sp.]